MLEYLQDWTYNAVEWILEEETELKELSRVAENVRASTTLAIDAMYKKMKADGIDVIGFGAGEPD